MFTVVIDTAAGKIKLSEALIKGDRRFDMEEYCVVIRAGDVDYAVSKNEFNQAVRPFLYMRENEEPTYM